MNNYDVFSHSLIFHKMYESTSENRPTQMYTICGYAPQCTCLEKKVG